MLSLISLTSFADAEIITVPFTPPGLLPGEKFHVAFMTAGKRDATSSQIADYNQFVRNEAQAAGAITESWGVNWFAIASTETIDARDNALISAPVYLLRKPPGSPQRLATGFTDMWDGTVSEFFVDQFGNNQNPPGQTVFYVYSGSAGDGTEYFTRSGLSQALGKNGAWCGDAFSSTNGEWISITGSVKEFARPFYALSEELTVSAIPEPSAFVLCLTAAVCITNGRRRIRRLES